MSPKKKQNNSKSTKNCSGSPDKLILKAEMICAENSARLTPIRKMVLEIIYEKNSVLTAYELLKLLKKVRPSAEAMTVYRALEFLEKHHFIHKILSKNAYTACDDPGESHSAQLISCEDCDETKEISAKNLKKIINAILKENHYYSTDKPLEIFGTCQTCQSSKDK
jgi:Fur family zinc uptake transcriptional regulator